MKTETQELFAQVLGAFAAAGDFCVVLRARECFVTRRLVPQGAWGPPCAPRRATAPRCLVT